jgi:hypothetical protein
VGLGALSIDVMGNAPRRRANAPNRVGLGALSIDVMGNAPRRRANAPSRVGLGALSIGVTPNAPQASRCVSAPGEGFGLLGGRRLGQLRGPRRASKFAIAPALTPDQGRGVAQQSPTQHQSGLWPCDNTLAHRCACTRTAEPPPVSRHHRGRRGVRTGPVCNADAPRHLAGATRDDEPGYDGAASLATASAQPDAAARRPMRPAAHPVHRPDEDPSRLPQGGAWCRRRLCSPTRHGGRDASWAVPRSQRTATPDEHGSRPSGDRGAPANTPFTLIRWWLDHTDNVPPRWTSCGP